MKHFSRVLILAIPFSFTLGLWWGLLQIEQGKSIVKNKNNYDLKILSIDNSISKNIISKYENLTESHIHLIEIANINHFLNSIGNSTNAYDLIILPSYILKPALINLKLQIIDLKKFTSMSNISPDFFISSLDHKNNKMIPFSWGLNGFISHSELKSFSLQEKLANKASSHQISLLNSPFELLSTMERLGFHFSEWIKNERVDLLSQTLAPFLAKVKLRDSEDLDQLNLNNNSIVQTTNGYAANFLEKNKDFHFTPPREKASLWVDFIVIPDKKITNSDSIYNFLNFLFKEDNYVLSITDTKKASTLKNLNSNKQLHKLQRAEYLRSHSVSFIDFNSDSLSYNQAWINALFKVNPKAFKALDPSPTQNTLLEQ